MPDTKYLFITLQKEVPSEAAGKEILTLVEDRFSDRPDIRVSGHVTTHFDNEEP